MSAAEIITRLRWVLSSVGNPYLRQGLEAAVKEIERLRETARAP